MIRTSAFMVCLLGLIPLGARAQSTRIDELKTVLVGDWLVDVERTLAAQPASLPDAKQDVARAIVQFGAGIPLEMYPDGRQYRPDAMQVSRWEIVEVPTPDSVVLRVTSRPRGTTEDAEERRLVRLAGDGSISTTDSTTGNRPSGMTTVFRRAFDVRLRLRGTWLATGDVANRLVVNDDGSVELTSGTARVKGRAVMRAADEPAFPKHLADLIIDPATTSKVLLAEDGTISLPDRGIDTLSRKADENLDRGHWVIGTWEVDVERAKAMPNGERILARLTHGPSSALKITRDSWGEAFRNYTLHRLGTTKFLLQSDGESHLIIEIESRDHFVIRGSFSPDSCYPYKRARGSPRTPK